MNAKSTFLSRTFSIQAGGRLLSFPPVRVMGILNITPDSFYAGSRVQDEASWLAQAERMLAEGADILDVGGQSTRPRATRLTAHEERSRVLPAIDLLAKRFPQALLSIDTFYADVAQAAIDHGCHIINDISAGALDPEMIPCVARLGVPYVIMHMQGTPQDMQDDPHYADVTQEILDFFIRKIAICREAGIGDILADPGFCFGKTQDHNYTLLRELSLFELLQVPILVGLSRKSMVWRPLGIRPAEALNGTTALHMLALEQGVHILRVHDVKEAVQAIHLWEIYRGHA
jgi:dihydropteroate synthase